MITFGIVGLCIIAYSVWVRKEKKQDILFVFGGLFLLVYSIAIGDLVFTILQVVFISSALTELFRLRKR